MRRPLLREMRAIAFANKLVSRGALADELKTMLIHAIEAEPFMRKLGVGSKLNADWKFLTHLRDQGRVCAESWLDSNFDHIGVGSTVDIPYPLPLTLCPDMGRNTSRLCAQLAELRQTSQRTLPV